MGVIRVVDSRTHVELATIQSFEVNTDNLADATTFGSMGSVLLPATTEDVEMRVSGFKIPVSPGPLTPAGELTGYRLQIAELHKIITALVQAMGGAVTLTHAEIMGASADTLTTEQTPEMGIIMRAYK